MFDHSEARKIVKLAERFVKVFERIADSMKKEDIRKSYMSDEVLAFPKDEGKYNIEKKDCHDCNGTGNYADDIGGALITRMCRYCEGKGYLNIIVDKESTINGVPIRNNLTPM